MVNYLLDIGHVPTISTRRIVGRKPRVACPIVYTGDRTRLASSGCEHGPPRTMIHGSAIGSDPAMRAACRTMNR